ncbi:DUF4369 domain-containing protein [Aquimarina sp. MMG016]|uniref:DUF4369 domain-containing protein n=1 Tax=Aquimarina sp. MMG016 TaxID=2822690 RepID=UPI001B3A2EFB|nr:DUF4369 domain-containing protein [Aquimarina sp. MMG016]MBQ4822853.1 DUF4369 domain-containing protein [Aquimarina sp. MMG016]
MKRLFFILSITLLLASCSNTPEKKGNVIIKGNIKGLKVGSLYLQKIQNDSLVNVDSILIDGNSEFLLYSDVTEPEIHYLYLDKDDGAQYNDRIDFFAEKGEMTVTTSLKDFEKDVKVIGGKNAMKYQEYKSMIKRFNDRNLRLMKEDFEANKQNDKEKLAKNDEAYKKLLKQKYLYTINFAMYNKKLEVAPYVTLQEVFDANIKYLDTVAKSLSPKVKKSIYGKQLIEYIKDRKEKETTTIKKEEE